MKKLIVTATLAIGYIACCGIAWSADWLTDGGDATRSGWVKDEKVFTKDNVKGLKLLWKAQTKNQFHALHSLMDPLVVSDVPTNDGKKEVVLVVGTDDNVYAYDSSNGKQVWMKHFSYENQGQGRGGGPAPKTLAEFASMGFLGPGGSTDVPAIGPADANGHRTMYVTDGGGNLHSLDISNGEDVKAPFTFGTSKFSLQLQGTRVVAAAGGRGIISTDINDPEHKVSASVGFGRSGGLWGRRGPAIDADGVVWTTTGDGNVDTTDPNNLMVANSMVGFKLQSDGSYHIDNYFTPSNWAWLWHRDLDPNNTPTIFTWKGKEYLVASGKECRLYLLDPKNIGGADHHTPLFRTPLFCNEEVDFQDAGSWGALSSWEDPSGTRWVLAPFWGPAHSQFKFPTVNQPATKDGGVAAFKLVDVNGKPELQAVWVSRDMHRGEPPVIANGVVFSYGSGEETRQAWPDEGLHMTSEVRAAKSGHATLFALDGQTGKELWSSGDQITSFNHFSGVTAINGKVYLGTYDGMLYCFGISK